MICWLISVASLWTAPRHCKMLYHGPCPSPKPIGAGARWYVTGIRSNIIVSYPRHHAPYICPLPRHRFICMDIILKSLIWWFIQFIFLHCYMHGYNSKIIDLVVHTVYFSALLFAHMWLLQIWSVDGLAIVWPCSFCYFFTGFRFADTNSSNSLVFSTDSRFRALAPGLYFAFTFFSLFLHNIFVLYEWKT